MDKKIKISLDYIKMFFIFLTNNSNDEIENLGNLNLSNKSSVKIISDYLQKEFKNLSISEQFRIKESLRYGLNFWSEKQLYSQYPVYAKYPIPTTITAKELYRQIWDYLFDCESIAIIDIDKYEIIDTDMYV